MVSWALILETAIKWLIPAICVAIVGLITAHFIKPFKKGNTAMRQDEWDQHFQASQEPKKMGDVELGKLKETVEKSDEKILKQLGDLSKSIEEQNKYNNEYHKKVDKSISLIQEGVRDAHLQNLISTCETYIKRGYITSTELDAYQSRYNLYKELGGNGHMDPWHAKITALPHEPPKPQAQPTSHGVPNPPITHV